MFHDQRRSLQMIKIAWRNYRPNELANLLFQESSSHMEMSNPEQRWVTDTKGQEVFEGLLHRRSEMEHGLHKALVTVCLVRFGVLLLANAFNIFFPVHRQYNRPMIAVGKM